MRPETAPALPVIRLDEYRPPAWGIDSVSLTFSLHPTATRVKARLAISRSAVGPRPDLVLQGRNLTVISAAIDGRTLGADDYSLDAESIVIPAAGLPGDAFTWECETEIDPKANTALEGLYMSRDMFCTQCEAEGFRKITFYPDRPDVMSLFTVRVEADARAFPVLLSNGNLIEEGKLEDGRHFATWHDPHPKPCYLFALVAGDLVHVEDHFTTASGRDVALKIFTRHGDESKTDYAMDALKRSMRWDEETYGCEYDLDLFMIVAVDDFNMGAMENKGLNVFNSKYVLASPQTATDRDYELIESVVAHEYFHNWTGNRITCRDWFQLCLKEGLTVFRDQQFSEDQRSASVMRIDGVKALRARQFREDAGPLAHPVRPEKYSEINNFYTATVYEKGAEVVRMLHTLVGPELYRKALDLYFERHDGQACTIEDFRQCFEDASGRDLSQFARWWSQSGTPRLTVRESYDAGNQRFTLSLAQQTPVTQDGQEKHPLHLPVRIALLAPSGETLLAEQVLEMTQSAQDFVFEGIAQEPLLSLNRGFGAPVIVERTVPEASLAALLAHESDPFNRWEAARTLAQRALLGTAQALSTGEPAPDLDAFCAAMGTALVDETLDPDFRALIWTLPGEDELAGEMARLHGTADPDALHRARELVKTRLAEDHRAALTALYETMATQGAYRPIAEDAGKRALRNTALAYLAQLGEEGLSRARTQFASADNMTDQMPALTLLVHHRDAEAASALKRFYQQWSNDALVLGKWFSVQATAPGAQALAVIETLTAHRDFDWKNPNKFRALLGSFAMGNPSGFHAKDGSGYKVFTDWLLKLDPVNPQTTSKLITAFETWRRYDAGRQALIKAQLQRLAGKEDLSRDAREMVTKVLGA
ncbi:MAG: aminopeptidase N [Neomegalonema sp.]|nr:aminopeptidase N [Neomegalonema sp.]